MIWFVCQNKRKQKSQQIVNDITIRLVAKIHNERMIHVQYW